MTDPVTVNIASHLAAMARDEPTRSAVFCPSGRDRWGRTRYLHWNYRELDQKSSRFAWLMELSGIRRGTRTVLMVPPSLEFFSLTFALFKVGAVPVLIDPGMGLKHLKRCIADAAPEAFLGVGKAQLARRILGWGRRTIHAAFTVDGEYVSFPYSAWMSPQRPPHGTDYPIATAAPDETAAILFTSGSTGPPKGAVYTHAIFAAQVEMLRSLYGIQPGEIDLCTFPLFALFAPALGMTAVIPEMDATRPAHVNSRNIREPIQSFGVTNLFGSPALLNRIATKGFALPSLRRVVSAGAPVPAKVIERMADMLIDEAQVFTPYGATESLPVASIGSGEIRGETRHATDQGAGVCVGRPVDGMRVAIIRISDEPIPTWSDDLLMPDGEIGEIAVQGPVVTREYFGRPEATRLAKIIDPSGGFWHRMGDVGYRDVQGRLWFCGRKSHRVISPSGTLFTIPCEAVFNTHPLVARTALVGIGAPGAMTPVLCVELVEKTLRPPDRFEGLRRELLAIGARFPHTREIQTFLFHPSFPVDIRHNAKIFREKLAVWAARKLR